MKVIISDLPQAADKAGEDCRVIVADGSGAVCRGCFGCWIKTPGMCVIRDGLDAGPLFGAAEELIIISRCCFGSTSPAVKKVLDRSISYMHPYFAVREGEMHHARRYDSRSLRLRACFYGPATAAEQETAKGILAANAVNLIADLGQVQFCPSLDDVWEVLKF